MADLITHLCSVLLPASLCSIRWTGPLAVGVVLPDVLGRAPAMAVATFIQEPGPISGFLLTPFEVFHMPVGILLSALLVGCFTIRRDRFPMVCGLALGGLIHVALDVTQFHHNTGYPLLFPFSRVRFEAGIIGSETTVGWSGGLAALTAGAWWIRWKVRSRIVQIKRN